MQAEQVTAPDSHHGEGPVWHTAWPGLRWVDMHAGDVLTLDRESGQVTRSHVGSFAAALRPCRDGGAVLALERGFALADDALTEVRPWPEVWSEPGVRMNEGGCDPDGRFYCGSMAYDETTPAGCLYRLGHDGSVSTVLRDVTVSNGLAWSPDGSTAYYVDSPTQRVDAFDYDSGELTRRRPVAEISAENGKPDGIAVDADGGLWVAVFGGGVVHHYDPGGELREAVEVPAPHVTACAFGGADLDELFITTSRVDTDLETYPGAGAVFRAKLAVRGLPPLPYVAA